MAHRITALALKSKASVLAEYNEISNSTETNKGTQMGAAHVSSRARPVSCYLCGNSAISCEKINPVDQLSIEPQVDNPENRSDTLFLKKKSIMYFCPDEKEHTGLPSATQS